MGSQGDIDAALADAEDALTTMKDQVGGTSDPSDASPSPGSEPDKDSTDPDVRRILKVGVPVIVRLARRPMPVREVMQFATGSIIEFDRPADGELDLMINNAVIGRGQAVKVGENFGLRVLHILSLREKIEALGGDADEGQLVRS
jgi:flagellar motor switch protein FliN/FliY